MLRQQLTVVGRSTSISWGGLTKPSPKFPELDSHLTRGARRVLDHGSDRD